uniref:Uncharacterized protein n=1 Tax=Caenorhabditis japonica TaxID=281687 RepID=A0A8R1EQ23_CAEJA
MIIQTMNNYDLMYNQKLKFQMDSGDVEFTTQLDCVDDREKFIEWMQEKKLRKMLSVMQPKLRIPDHQKIVKEKCDGMFRDGNDGLEIFDGSRGFERHNFTAINMEIALMTPAMIVENM